MAGTTTVIGPTVLREPVRAAELIQVGYKHEIDWTSDASGNVSGTSIQLRGWGVKAITVPDGTDVPSDNYGITLIDPDTSGFDALRGLLAARDTANTEEVYLNVAGNVTPIYFNGTYEFKVAAAGNAKKGKLFLYILNE